MILIAFFLASICLLAAVIPFFPMAHGIVRVFDFPRIQFALLSAGLVLTSISLLPLNVPGLLTAAMAMTALAIQLYYMLPFTPLRGHRTKAFEGNSHDVASVKLLVSNVKMSNRKYDLLQKMIRDTSPDIALFMETDKDWVDALDQVTSDYPFRLSCPLGTSYGLHLVSRFPFESDEIKFLLKDEVPSFDIVIKQNEHNTFRLIAIHPEPPVIKDETVGRDAEIALVGENIRDYEKPLIVTGDLNDVAWSRTTRRFLRISRLLDPREGRGFFNTFDARFFFLRWPLDHIFHSPHFQLIAIKRMPFVGSDHFPMFYNLALTGQQSINDPVESASKQDFKEVDDVIKQEKNRDKAPVGTNWED